MTEVGADLVTRLTSRVSMSTWINRSVIFACLCVGCWLTLSSRCSLFRCYCYVLRVVIADAFVMVSYFAPFRQHPSLNVSAFGLFVYPPLVKPGTIAVFKVDAYALAIPFSP